LSFWDEFKAIFEKAEPFHAPEVTFAAEGGTDSGEFQIFPARTVFEFGDYPDKNFSMGAEEFQNPGRVDLDIEHRPTVFEDSKIGFAENHRVEERDGKKALVADVSVNKFLVPLLKEQSGLSATWDRAGKKLSKVALTISPRIESALLNATFATFASSKKRHDTRVGQSQMQELHDTTARYGAVCKANFASKHENQALQSMHDLAVEHGAACDDGTQRNAPYYFSQENNDMTKEELKEALVEFGLAPKDGGGDTSDKGTKDETAVFSLTDREKTLLDKNAATFAQGLVARGAVLPAQEAMVKETYALFAADDLRDQATVEFSKDGKTEKLSRTDLLERLLSAKGKVDFSVEFSTGQALTGDNDGNTSESGGDYLMKRLQETRGGGNGK
jgi:hypothetical protein